MEFEIIGKIAQIETLAVGHGIRELANLRRLFGDGAWRKLKGLAMIRLPSGTERIAELHWYEAHGIGKRKYKIKRFVD